MLAILQPESVSRTFACCICHLHQHSRNMMSDNLVTEMKKMLTHGKIGTKIAFCKDLMSKIQICLIIFPMMQELSPCLDPKPISIWWYSCGGYMQGWMLTSSTGCAFWVSHASISAVCARPDLVFFDRGITEPSRIWLPPHWEVPRGIRDIPGTMSRHSISSPNVVGAGAAASRCVHSSTTAGTLKSDLPYFVSLSWR